MQPSQKQNLLFQCIPSPKRLFEEMKMELKPITVIWMECSSASLWGINFPLSTPEASILCVHFFVTLFPNKMPSNPVFTSSSIAISNTKTSSKPPETYVRVRVRQNACANPLNTAGSATQKVLVATRIPDRSSATMTPLIKYWCLPGIEIVSDAWPGYNDLQAEGFRHVVVVHK